MNSRKSLLYLTQSRGLFLGDMPLSFRARQPSPTLYICLDGNMRIKYKDCELVAKSIVVPAGIFLDVKLSHPFVADFMLNRLSMDFQLLKENSLHFMDEIYYQFSEEYVFIEELRQIYAQEPDITNAINLLTSKISHLNFTHRSAYIDPRIKKVVEYIRDTPYDNEPIEHLAEKSNLSVPRLIYLFKQQTGVPIRKYRQWRRLFEVAKGVANNKDITRAAIDSGFNDSPHFCKTFKEMFGVSPGKIFTYDTKVIMGNHSSEKTG